MNLDKWPDNWHVVCKCCHEWISMHKALENSRSFDQYATYHPHGACYKCGTPFIAFYIDSEVHAFIAWSRWRKL